ncbi:MAG TPA: hypothetical protein VMC09_02305 [Anaerolineales bacterium]|nr:hypothetical protein [Anaerolineales bacterium]
MVRKWIWLAAVIVIAGGIVAAAWLLLRPHTQPSLGTPAASPDPDLSSAYFPLAAGDTWTYSFTSDVESPEGSGNLATRTGTFSEQVIGAGASPYKALHIYQAELTGEVLDEECTGGTVVPGPLRIWYILDETRLFIACTDGGKDGIVKALYDERFVYHPTPAGVLEIPELIFPLAEGAGWAAFPGIAPDSYHSYGWYVDQKLELNTSAGDFKDCYRVVLDTNPDTSIRYFCNGVGFVAFEYHHHGSALDFRVDLTSYFLISHP